MDHVNKRKVLPDVLHRQDPDNPDGDRAGQGKNDKGHHKDAIPDLVTRYFEFKSHAGIIGQPGRC